MLQDLFVKEVERGKGIAKQILELAEQEVQKRDYVELGIDVEIKNTWVKEFYEKVDFKVILGPVEQSWTEKDSGKVINTQVYHLRKAI